MATVPYSEKRRKMIPLLTFLNISKRTGINGARKRYWLEEHFRQIFPDFDEWLLERLNKQ